MTAATLESGEEWNVVPVSRVFGGAATIAFPRLGGAARRVVTGSKKFSTGSFYSTKMERSFEWEGEPEAFAVRESEVDGRILAYQTQPCQFRFPLGGKVVTYTPDQIRLFDDGSIDVPEIKRTPSDLEDADYVEKLDSVRRIAESVGWQFRILFRHVSQISLAKRHNVARLISRRHVEVPNRTMGALDRIIAFNTTHLAFKDAVGLLADGDRRLGPCIIDALIARGRLVVDLDKPLTDDTPLELRARRKRPLPTSWRIRK